MTCMCGPAHVSTACRSWFSTMWTLRSELRLSGVVASALYLWSPLSEVSLNYIPRVEMLGHVLYLIFGTSWSLTFSCCCLFEGSCPMWQSDNPGFWFEVPSGDKCCSFSCACWQFVSSDLFVFFVICYFWLNCKSSLFLILNSLQR